MKKRNVNTILERQIKNKMYRTIGHSICFRFTIIFLFLAMASCERVDEHINVIHDTVYLRPSNPEDPADPNEPIVPSVPPVGGFDSCGASNALFSINYNRKVHFSKGNLQYNASTNTWRFAEHQYDFVGANNANISRDYDGWIDLFGWGTSGWNSGATCYHPWSYASVYSYYYPGGNYTNNLTGNYSNADWGVYNRISNGGDNVGMWRTLTKEEWLYLFWSRSGADSKYGTAIVNGKNGIVILPDVWTTPSGMNFSAGLGSYDRNVYTVSEWHRMESYGAIFLPTAGARLPDEATEAYCTTYHSGYCSYWSSTCCGYDDAYRLIASPYQNTVECNGGNNSILSRSTGHSVRLVRE